LLSTLSRTQLIDEQYLRLNPSDCSLAIYLTSKKILYSALDKVHHKVLAVNEYELEKMLKDNIWSEAFALLESAQPGIKSIGEVKIALDYGKSLLVPQDLFVESEMGTYLDFSLSAYEQPEKDFIDSIPAYNIYSLPAGFPEAVKKVFDKFAMYHVSTPFIENIIRENKNLRVNKIFVSLSGNAMHVAAVEQGRFVFYNGYSFKTKEDFVYYLMAVAEELSFHPEEIQISVSGTITPDSEYYQTARRFLKNITFSERPKALKYSAKLDTVPKHFFALLYSIHLCE